MRGGWREGCLGSAAKSASRAASVSPARRSGKMPRVNPEAAPTPVTPTVSVVIPIYNESENLPELRRRLVAALEQAGETWEVVFVNDGSRDASPAMLRQYH